ncbi:MAG: penicillin-binding protein 2 [Patescibacteria group bacterium]
MRDIISFRTKILSLLIVFVGVILISKLYLVQIVYSETFKAKADHQYVYRGSQVFDRGNIYLTQKDGSLVGAATLKSGFTLVINPKILAEAGTSSEAIYEKINKIYPIEKEEFLRKALLVSDPYEEIAKKVPEEEGKKISDLGIQGVILEKDRWRYYPGGNLASHVLGFVGFKGDVLAGRYGIERYYDDVLSRNEKKAYNNFFAQIFSNVKTSIQKGTYQGEGDIVLTIEPSVQQHLENILQKVKKEYSADSAGGIIMNPMNGEIYAMGVTPNFNPNEYNLEKYSEIFGNPIVENVYEMGSIIKPLTVASGLDSGVVTAQTTYDDKGSVTLDGKTFSNYDGKARGIVPMQEVLSQSLNTGVSFVVTRLGNKQFADYMRNFGLGEETGIDLPGELPGLIKNLESTRDIEYATASFGQGIALTPIETVRALSALGNGGTLITPHVVREIRYKIGISKPISYDADKRIIKRETSEEITRMLSVVVDKALLGGKIKMEHYTLAAKTGTAQISKGGGGGYYEDRYLHSFFGYLPAYNPKFIVFFYMYYPKVVRFASETLTMPFSETAKFLINYYNIPPDR